MKKVNPLKKLMVGIDIIIEIVDARDIDGTRIRLAEKFAGTNRLMIVVNKKDLLSKGRYIGLPKNAIVISAKNGGEKDRTILMNAMMKKAKKTGVKALFIGYPNVGKSSTINMLARKKAAKVAPIAGTTKDVQWIRINENLLVTDYRGIFPRGEKKEDLIRKGAINIEQDAESYAHNFAKKILESTKMRKWAEKKFDINLEDIQIPEKVLELIAKRRGFYIKGGELNIEETAKLLIRAMKEAPEI